jgi:hypothetical protein
MHSKLSTAWRHLLAVALSLAVAIPAFAAGTVEPKERQPVLKEQAFDVRDRSIDLNRRTFVDVNSILELHFVDAALTKGAAVTAPEEVQRLENVLKKVREFAAEQKAFRARARSSVSVPGELGKQAKAFNEKADALMDQWEAALRQGDPLGLQDVLTGDADGGNPSLPYQNLARWLTREIERLQAANREELAKHLFEVNVSAFLQRGTNQAQRIGVPGYDNIAIGSPDPISRTGLQLSAAEAARLDARLKATEEIAKLLRQIQDDWAEKNQQFSADLAKLKDKMKELPDEFRRQLKTLNSLGDLRTELGQLKQRADLDASKKNAVVRLLDALESFENEKKAVQDKIAELTQLYEAFDGRVSPKVLTDLAGALQNLSGTITKLQGVALDMAELFQKWTTRLEGDELKNDIEVVALLIAEEKIAPLNEFTENFGRLVKIAKPIIDAASGIAAVLKNSHSFDKVSAGLADAKIEENWFKDQLAPDTQIALDSIGILPGDRVNIKVTYRQNGADETAAPSPKIYYLDATQFGVHRKIDATLIFARPLKETEPGEPKRWRPNAAATAHWFFRHRPDASGELTGGKKAWNFINPGFGIHAASLAQGDDSVEVGLGANFSLLDGMLTGGYGYNLSTEKPYVFIGIGLLEVLDRARRPGAASASGSN